MRLEVSMNVISELGFSFPGRRKAPLRQILSKHIFLSSLLPGVSVLFSSSFLAFYIISGILGLNFYVLSVKLGFHNTYDVERNVVDLNASYVCQSQSQNIVLLSGANYILEILQVLLKSL